MNSLIIEGTKETPQISFNTNGELTISGISTPSNINGFYQPLFDWINKLVEFNPNAISMKFMMDYINTSSSRIFVDMIKLIEDFKKQGVKVNIAWFYEAEDEDMLELGEDFQIVTGADFSFQEIEE